VTFDARPGPTLLALACATAVLASAGCGQKGPLVLPDGSTRTGFVHRKVATRAVRHQIVEPKFAGAVQEEPPNHILGPVGQAVHRLHVLADIPGEPHQPDQRRRPCQRTGGIGIMQAGEGAGSGKVGYPTIVVAAFGQAPGQIAIAAGWVVDVEARRQVRPLSMDCHQQARDRHRSGRPGRQAGGTGKSQLVGATRRDRTPAVFGSRLAGTV